MSIRVIAGDCRTVLPTLPETSIHCCVTSPPYFGLRDYGVDGQIGLESTVEAYVSELVDVFREVRRVLRDDGVLFLNLGDSYANDTKWGGSSGGKHVTALHGASGIGRQKVATGLKAKDLIGIPWRVAFALQQPYYTGRIKNEHDRIWLAAMIDAEGCMFIHKRKVGQHNGQGYHRKNASYGAGLEVSNTSEGIVQRCLEVAGAGSICRVEKDRNQPLYRWNLRTNECRDIVREVYPYLVGKKQQARILLGCPSSGERADAAHQAMMLIHCGSETTVEFPEPASMYEPGYYLRSDIIWHKNNPMPESVTDRPTKSHEYIFLMSKNPRYFWDAEAVKEPHAESSIERASYASKPRERNVGGRTDGYTTANVQVPDGGRNIRSVWTIPTHPYTEAHFATFPPALAERCIKAGSKAGDTVLDPFGGAGTVGLVADRLGRDATLIELNPEYAAMARTRITGDAPMFAQVGD